VAVVFVFNAVGSTTPAKVCVATQHYRIVFNKIDRKKYQHFYLFSSDISAGKFIIKETLTKKLTKVLFKYPL